MMHKARMWYRRGALLFSKVIHVISRSHGTKNSPIFTRIERLRTVTPVWIHQWICNNPQSLMWCRRGALYFATSSIKFQSHTGWKIYDLNPICVALPGRLQLSNPSDLPCSKSSIKFQGHMGWKIWDLNPIWVRLLGQSQLSNPSDLPCF